MAGGSRSKTSRLMASLRSRLPPFVARSLPQPSMLTSNRLHLAAQSTLNGQLGAPGEGRHAPLVAAAGGPAHVVGLALVGHGRAVPVGRERRADAAARLADDRDRQPAGRPLDLADPQVQLADRVRAVERAADEGVHRAVGVELAHPVDLGSDAEPREGAHEQLAHEVARIGRGRAAFRGRHVRERDAHVALHRIGGQEGLGVHGVEIVHPVEEAARPAGQEQRPMDGVVEDDAPERADVHGARGRLRVVDDLRSIEPCRQLVSPEHRVVLLPWSWRRPGGCPRTSPPVSGASAPTRRQRMLMIV